MSYAQDYPVVYINLQKDIEKSKILQSNLKKAGFSEYQRIDAVYGKNLKDAGYRKKIGAALGVPADKLKPSFWLDRSNFKTMSPYEHVVLPKVGCYLSHLLAIKTALEKGYNGVLVLEDDSFPLKNIKTKFTIPKDADVYYLGGTFFHQKQNIKENNSKHILLNPEELKLCGTFSYILPNKEKMLDMYNLFMSVFNDEEKSNDIHAEWRTGYPKMRAQSADFMYINYFQKYGTSYVINPVLFSHKEMGSNIGENRKTYNLTFFYHPKQKKQLDP